MKYVTKENEEVKMGDVIYATIKRKTEFGETTLIIRTTLTPDNVDSFIKEGILKEKKDKAYTPLAVYNALIGISKELDLPYDDTKTLIEYFVNTCPSIAFKMLSMQMSKNLITKKELKKLEKVYIICDINGKIYSVNTKDVKSFDTFAAFKTKEDAEKVRDILGTILNRMFNE